MIFIETRLIINDNSGGKRAKCLKVVKSSKSSGCKPADLIIISIKKIRRNKNVRKGQICRGIFTRGKKNHIRLDGSSIKFSDNALVLIDKKEVPIGTRIVGLAYKELRNKDYPKVLALAKIIL
jgi:large subunit ribosomal protein L14